jgi:hypothetical protein
MSCWLTGSSDAIWKVYTLNKSQTKFESNWPYLHVLQKIYKFHRKTEYFKPLINIKLQLILNLDVGVLTIWKKYVASNCGHLGWRPRLSNEISKLEMPRINTCKTVNCNKRFVFFTLQCFNWCTSRISTRTFYCFNIYLWYCWEFNVSKLTFCTQLGWVNSWHFLFRNLIWQSRSPSKMTTITCNIFFSNGQNSYNNVSSSTSCYWKLYFVY